MIDESSPIASAGRQDAGPQQRRPPGRDPDRGDHDRGDEHRDRQPGRAGEPPPGGPAQQDVRGPGSAGQQRERQAHEVGAVPAAGRASRPR